MKTTQQYYEKIEKQISEIITKAQGYMKDISPDFVDQEIRKAYKYAKDAHKGQKRYSGAPYIIHPVGATKELMSITPDMSSIQACLLHDVIEDTEVTKEDVEKYFGDDVAKIAAAMEKVKKVRYRGEQRQAQNIRKTFIKMSEDIRSIIVKFSDRIHNLKTLRYHPNPEKRKRIALESMVIYAPIANQLGIHSFKDKIETLSMKYLYPDAYRDISRDLKKLTQQKKAFIEQAKIKIKSHIKTTHPIKIQVRVKSVYSIYKKLLRKKFDSIDLIHDIFAIRIITENVEECYNILGQIHQQWIPVDKKIKDYIARPKKNHYQSLHTTIFGILPEFNDKPTEIQIRTQKMHEESEIGIASHFHYKQTGLSVPKDMASWVVEIRDALADSSDTEVLQWVQVDPDDKYISVFTPNGDVKELPRNATALDFAYSIHANIGNTISIAIVNGTSVPIDTQLYNGDVVNIRTDKNQQPKEYWLSFVQTRKARQNIRSALLKINKNEIIERGKDILDTYLKKTIKKPLDKSGIILESLLGKKLNKKDKEAIFIQIGNFSKKPSTFFKSVTPDSRPLGYKKAIKTEKPKNKQIVVVAWNIDLPCKIANCCTPTIEDNIIGVVKKGFVSIHKPDCRHTDSMNPQKVLPAFWEINGPKILKIHCNMVFKNKKWVLRKLSDIFDLMDINIEKINQENENGYAKLLFVLESMEEDHYIYQRLIQRIKIRIPEYRGDELISIE